MKNEPTNANSMFNEGKLSLGLMFPLESYQGDVPTMANQESLACLSVYELDCSTY